MERPHALVDQIILGLRLIVDPNVSSMLNVQVPWLVYEKNAEILALALAAQMLFVM